MDLWQLHVFCKVVELKSFSKAGEAIHLSQPTVSSHIKDLEAHFSTRLIDRLSRHVAPTKAGELLYDYAHRLIVLRDRTEAAMAEFCGEVKGRLTIGGSTIPGGYLLPRIIGQFCRTYPDVRISLVVADTSEIIAKTVAGHIEIGVVGAKSSERKLQQAAIIDDEMRLVVPRGHKWARRRRVDLSELIHETFIIRESGSGTLRSIEEQLQTTGCSINDFKIVAEMGSTEAIRQAIKNQVGISILSTIAVADDVQAGLLKTIDVSGLNLKRSFYLTTHRRRSPSPLSSTFIQFLEKELTPG